LTVDQIRKVRGANFLLLEESITGLDLRNLEFDGYSRAVGSLDELLRRVLELHLNAIYISFNSTM
jgi:hypothetical protein